MAVDVPARPTKPPGPRLWIGLVVIAVGVVGLVVGSVMAFHKISATLRSPTYVIPSEFTVALKPGNYVIYQQTGSSTTAGPANFTTNSYPTLAPQDVEVTDPDGNVLSTEQFDASSETITRESEIYTGALKFHATVAGDYQFVFSDVTGKVIVSSDLFDTFKHAVPGLIIDALSGLVLVVGVVLLIVGAVRQGRRKAASPQFAGAMPAMPTMPPGWYPDPQGGGTSRYWDGWQWTSHQSRYQ